MITRPDKGRGVVILNKADYDAKMVDILSDTSKFRKIELQDHFKYTIKIEDKINRHLKKFVTNKSITQPQYNELYCSGTQPGVMYGPPKTHKHNTLLRPILAAYKTPSYNIAKFLVTLLQDHTTNEYTIKNSYEFQKWVTQIHLPQVPFLASFDVQSLFTNIPLTETIDLICNKLFNSATKFHGFNKADFRQLLSLACQDTFLHSIVFSINKLMVFPWAPH